MHANHSFNSARGATLVCACLLSLCLPLLAAGATQKEEEAKLIAVLQAAGGDLNEKDQACRRLAVIGSKASVPVLMAMLTDDKMSDVARYALETIPDASVEEVLRAGLSTYKGKALMGVVQSLGNRKDAASVGEIAKLLKDADPFVVNCAANALTKIGNSAAAEALVSALGGASDEQRPVLANYCIATADAMLVQNQRDQAGAIFAQVCKSKLPAGLKAAALRGCVLCSGSAGIPLVLENLKSSEKEMARIALRLVRELPGADATQAFASELGKLPEDRRVLLLVALGDRHDAAALPAIAQAAKSGEATVRIAAMRVLSQFGDVAAVPVLFDALSVTEPQAEVAKTAQAALAGLPQTKDINDAIVAVLEKGDAKARRIAIDVIGDRRIASAVPALLKATDDQDEQIRTAALRVLGEAGGIQAFEILVQKLSKPKVASEIAVAETGLSSLCARIQNKAACSKLLVDAFPKSETPSKCAILRLLRLVGGDDALKLVRASRNDADAGIKDAAMRAIFDWPSIDVAGDLLEIAKSPAANQTQAVLALRGYIRLATLKELPVAQRMAICKESITLAKRPDERKAVLGALGEIPDIAALEMIEAQLSDPAVKNEAQLAAVRACRTLATVDSAAVKAVVHKMNAATENKGIKKSIAEVQGILSGCAGSLCAWMVAGPYLEEGKGADVLFDTAFPPEKDAKDVVWTVLPAGTDRGRMTIMDLSAAIGGDKRVAYARTWIKSDAAQPVKFAFGTDDGSKLWLNGKQVHANNAGGAATPDKYKVDATLKAGWNALLLKVVQDAGPWEFCFRVCKPDGSPLTLKAQLFPPAE